MSLLRSTLAAVLVSFGASAVASAQQPTTTAPEPHGRHAGPAGRGMHQMGDRNPFLRGLTLSDAEKANLKTINSQHAAQMKALREKFKPQHDAMRAARQKGDTAAVRRLFAQSQDEREQMQQLMTSQRKDVRAALTPENQAKFDANIATMEKRLAERKAKGEKFGRGEGRRGPRARPDNADTRK